MTEYSGSMGNTGMGHGAPNADALMNTSWGSHTNVSGMMENANYPLMNAVHPNSKHEHGHMHGHKHVHAHGCAPAHVVPAVVKTSISAELVLFILLVIIIRCANW
ncbi:hypothetical protein ACK8P5_14725 [Paenibacillus sp. EC2-1]|uniref:hypothetical protein n=1 Tax=Paenibacillus sp. EC2-1 TaxID=3388665 RepID=UPI003BEF43DA